MSSPTVSIIMPCHNGSKTIADAIRSVQCQAYCDWELLVINDNSTDESVNIVSNFCEQDCRIILLENKTPTGFPATPRNVGIQAARGRFIAFLDCDDVWEITKLANQVTLFDNQKIAVVFSFYKKMDENACVRQGIIESPAKVDYEKLLKGNCIGNLTGIYDTALMGKIFQKEIHHEDYLMWLEILSKGFLAINTCTVEAVYRESSNSVSGGKIKSLLWTWDIYIKELHLPFLKSCICFLNYALKGLVKFSK